MKTDNIIITLSGLHGVGKSVYSKAISEKFELNLHSTGEYFRRKAEMMGLTLEEFSSVAAKDERIDLEIDSKAREHAQAGGVVVDGLLTGWLLKNTAHIKILLIAPLEERIRRIAIREGTTVEKARQTTVFRERSERERFKSLYNIDITDLSIYDVVLDTFIIDIPTVKEVLFKIIEAYLKLH